jgi:hypothetical protein
MVDGGVKKNLLRAHGVVLKDGGERVVVQVESVITPVDVERGSRSEHRRWSFTMRTARSARA